MENLFLTDKWKRLLHQNPELAGIIEEVYCRCVDYEQHEAEIETLQKQIDILNNDIKLLRRVVGLTPTLKG